jgi:hypothetical protein
MFAPYFGLQDNPLAAGQACTLDPYFPPEDTQDPHWASVVLLLQMQGENGSTTFVDSSSSARTPATVSNVELTSLEQRWGATSGRATAGSPVLEYTYDTDFDFPGSGVWTVEFWVYLLEAGATEVYFLGRRGALGKYFRLTTAETMTWRDSDTTEITFGTVGKNTWTHVALSCDGTNLRSYVNGRRVTVTASSSFADGTTDAYSIFSASTAWATSYLRGYLQDIRITQGVARYTTDGFTIPQRAYPTTLEDPSIDANPRTVSLLQFKPPGTTPIFTVPGTTDADDTTEYLGEAATATVTDATAVAYGVGGLEFVVDNTDNRITYAATKKFDFWRYRVSRVVFNVTIEATPSGTGGCEFFGFGYTVTAPQFGWAVAVTSGVGSIVCVAYDSASNNSTAVSGISFPYTAELAIQFRDDGIYDWFIDGVIVRTYTGNNAYVPLAEMMIGPDVGATGGVSQIAISDFRFELVSNVDRALYKRKHSRQLGNGELSAAQSKFGGYSLYAPAGGSGSWFLDWHQDFLMGVLDWTVECWAYRLSNAAVGTLMTLPGSTTFKFSVGTDGLIDVAFYSAGGSASANNIATFPLSSWEHVAVQRRGGNFEVYLSGDLVNTTAVPGGSSADQGATAAMYVGRESGYIDEFRVVRGVAVYSDGYTPPSTQFCTYSGDAVVPGCTPKPTDDEPIAFAAVTRASLFGVVGSAISSTTLATITCADSAMTVRVSHEVPGLTFSYASNVLTVAGTPTGPSSLTRVVVSYIASDGSCQVRGSTEHEITIVDATEVLTIGSMAGASGRVGQPMAGVTLCTLSSNFAVDLRHVIRSGMPPQRVIGVAWLQSELAWTKGATSGSGSMKLSLFIPDYGGTYNLIVDYFGFGVLLGTSTHEIVITSSYQPPAPAPSPVPAPPAPAPSPPPVPSPAPAPGRGPDSLFSFVKVLMHFDSATGIATDVKGNTFTNQGATLGTGAVSEGAIFTSAATRIEGSVAGIDGSSGTLCVEAMVDIDATAWSALMDGSLTDNRFCPVVTLIDNEGEVVWTLGFASTRNRTGPEGRHVRPTMFNALTGFQFGYPAGSQCAVTHAYPELKARPGRFVHLAATRRANPVSPTDGSYDQGTWFDGLAGGYRAVPYISLLKTVATGTLRIGGACPRIEYVIEEVMQRDVTIVPFSGAIDELRITAYQRYVDYLFPGLLAWGQQVSAIPAHARVIPWPNY